MLHNHLGSGADPGFFLGGGALVSCSTSTPINHIVFFLQNTSCIRKPQVISGGGGGGPPRPPPPPPRTPCTLPLDPPLRVDQIWKTFAIINTFRFEGENHYEYEIRFKVFSRIVKK